MPCWAGQAARSLPTALRRGMGREPEPTERPGMRFNSQGMRSSTPGTCRESKRADRRGMCYRTPGMRRMFEPTERPGMCYRTPGMRSSTPGTLPRVKKSRPTRQTPQFPKQWPPVRDGRPRHLLRCPIEPLVIPTLLAGPPNGMPFSCRKRCNERVKNRTIARAQRSAGTAGWARWPLTRVCCPHDRTTPARNHAGTTRRDRNHAQHPITRPTTGNPHDGPSNHAGTTGHGTTRLAQRAFTSATGSYDQKGRGTTLPSRPTDCASAAASASNGVKMAMISCA